MTSKNAPCPCGSNKQYKRCCGKEEKGKKRISQPKENIVVIDFNGLIDKYDGIHIAKFLGAITLDPANHGRNARLESMTRMALAAGQKNKPQANWDLICSIVSAHTDGRWNEDPLNNFFSENIVFSEGNYIVFPGLNESSTRVLNELLECIFLQKHELPTEFVNEVKQNTELLLQLSNAMARSLQYRRLLKETEGFTDIHVSDYDSFIKYISAISFSHEYIKKLCNYFKLDPSLLAQFTIALGDPMLQNDDPSKNPLNTRPLLRDNDGITICVPTNILPALIEFIYAKAAHFKILDDVKQLLVGRQMERMIIALKQMGWHLTNIGLPDHTTNLELEECVFQIDHQKFGYVCLIGRVKNENKKKNAHEGNWAKERMEEINRYLAGIAISSQHQVLTLFVLAETAEDVLFAWPGNTDDSHLSLCLTANDLEAIAYNEKSSLLTLWKYAKIFARTSQKVKIWSVGSALDAFEAYESNKGSFLDPNEANPIGGQLLIPPGISKDYSRQAIQYRDEHAAKVFFNGGLSFNKVIRYKSFAPIYTEKEPLVTQQLKSFRLVIETYQMPIWICYYYEKGNTKLQWPKALCEGTAFWLHKMADKLKGILQPVTLIQFEIEIIVDPNYFNDDYPLEWVEQDAVHIGVRIDAPKIKISVPLDFLSVVALRDNSADKMLMQAVLRGLNNYVNEANGSSLFKPGQIDAIVEETLQPAAAKMLLLTDPTQDKRLDSRGLISERLIHEADTSYILDNLVSYLPASYHIPLLITTVDEKRNLCNDIVLALLNQIETRLKTFDGLELLQLLIKMNEKIVQVRKMQDIYLPPRIACYSSFDKELDNLLETESQQIIAGQTLRTLIEFVAADLPTGLGWANYDEIEELMALAEQVIQWGSQSDAIWKLAEDPAMGLLPSGRIGKGKNLQETVFQPYHFVKTSENLYETIEDFDKNYDKQTSKADATQVTDPVEEVASLSPQQRMANNAFIAETGFLLTELTDFVNLLSDKGFSEQKACMVMKEDEIVVLAHQELPAIPGHIVLKMLDYLCLLPRPRIQDPHPDYPRDEIFPWRHKRVLSHLRKPLARIMVNGNPQYYFGFRHLMNYLENLYFLLYMGKYPRPKSKELIAWLGSVANKKGNPFRTKAMRWFASHGNLITVPEEIDITEDGPLFADRNYGDIDILVADPAKKIIYSIECKNISGAKTVYEIWSEMDGFIGEGKQDKDAKIVKHTNRHEWLLSNHSQLSKYIPDAETYQIKSFVLAPEELPLTYLKGKDIPLPVVSFVSLRRNSIALLDGI